MHKIAIVLPDLRGGGAERVSLDLAYEFRREGYDVTFLLMQPYGELFDEACSSFTVTALNISRLRYLPYRLARYLRRNSPDVLLVSMWPLTVLVVLAKVLSGCHRCKLVLVEHSILSSQYLSHGKLFRVIMRISMAIGYRLSDARVGVSKGVVSDIAQLSLLKSSAFQVIHNPIPRRSFPSFDSLSLSDKLWGVPSGARILSVANFKTVKNQDLLLRAFSKLDQLEDKKLMLVGKGEGEAGLRALAEQLGISDKVIFAGYHLDPTPLYMTANLFVLTSSHEGFGNVIVEALACGIPVVSTDCPSGPAEILAYGKYGTLVPVNDVDLLTSAITATLGSEHDSARLMARATIFSTSVAAEKYLELLD